MASIQAAACTYLELIESDIFNFEQPSIHAKEAWKVFESQAGADVYKYIPFNRPETWQEFLTHQEKHRRTTAWQDFAIIDKTRRSGPRLAGMISMINSSAENLCSELGAVFVFPEFQVSYSCLRIPAALPAKLEVVSLITL